MNLFQRAKNLSEVNKFCDFYSIKNYHVDKDGAVDVKGTVSLLHSGHSYRNEEDFLKNKKSQKLNIIPIKFKRVIGHFYVDYNSLTSLENCPEYVIGDFSVNGNNLTSLKGSPNGGTGFIGDLFIEV